MAIPCFGKSYSGLLKGKAADEFLDRMNMVNEYPGQVDVKPPEIKINWNDIDNRPLSDFPIPKETERNISYFQNGNSWKVNMINNKELKPMKIDKVHYKGITYIAQEPIYIELSHEDGYFIANNEEIGFNNLYFETMKGLKDAIPKEIHIVWTEYAEVDDNELSGDAIELKNRLLRIFKKVINGK